jgi:ATP-dependent Clp protease ATP-binding subunit ClpC
MSELTETTVPIDRFGRCALLAWQHAAKARDEAPNDHRRPAIMTAHILLGVLQEPTCAGGLILRSMGLDLQLAIDTTRFMLFYGRRPGGLGRMAGEIVQWQKEPHTPESMRAIKHSLDEAELFHAEYPIGTEHLLLGILRVTEGMAFSTLAHLGITHAGARTARDTFWERLKLLEG